MTRYTISITKPVSSAEYIEDEQGEWVKASYVQELEERIERARSLCGGVFALKNDEWLKWIGPIADALDLQDSDGVKDVH